MSWVQVESEVPPPLVDVLVVYELFEGQHTTDFAYRKRNGRWVLTGSHDREIQPSHWMHVPALPDELEDAA